MIRHSSSPDFGHAIGVAGRRLFAAGRDVFLFPGQGSQYVGMGRQFHEASAAARALFARADAVLRVPITALCFEGPEIELRRTENAQPALFVVSAAASLVLQERGIVPAAAAGHSAGEYAALMAAGALTFEDGLRAVRRRGELMAAAAERMPGTMALIAGLTVDIVEEICVAASSAGSVEVANENSPSETVISGELPAIARALELAEERDAAVVLPLAVAAAFHSRLMAPVTSSMAEMLATLPLSPARLPVVANSTGDYVRTPNEIRDALLDQVRGRVRWSACMRRLVADTPHRLIEVGAGRALTRLARELAPGIPARTVEQCLAEHVATPEPNPIPSDPAGTSR